MIFDKMKKLGGRHFCQARMNVFAAEALLPLPDG